jgi:hypothetical protein
MAPIRLTQTWPPHQLWTPCGSTEIDRSSARQRHSADKMSNGNAQTSRTARCSVEVVESLSARRDGEKGRERMEPLTERMSRLQTTNHAPRTPQLDLHAMVKGTP